MRHLLIVVLALALDVACGAGDEGFACKVDADCDKGLMCGLLQSAEGGKRTMCVNPDTMLSPTSQPKSARSYILPVGIGAVFVGILLALRSSVRAREKRQRAKATKP